MKTGIYTAFAALMILPAFTGAAEVGYFVPKNNSWNYFVYASNWTNAQGEALAVAPTNINDTAYLSVYEGSDGAYYKEGYFKTILGWTKAKSTPGSITSIELKKLVSEQMPVLTFGTERGDNVSFPSQKFSLDDPDDFMGYWEAAAGRGQIILRGDENKTPALSHVNTYGYMGINIQNADTAASVETLLKAGAIRKSGDGSLEVKEGAGMDSHIYVESGAVVLDGMPDGTDCTAPVSGAWLHLDASAPGTITSSVDDEGRDRVTKWYDCDGGNIYAEFRAYANTDESKTHLITSTHPPYKATVTGPTGLPLIDFGAGGSEDAAQLGKGSNCWMKLSATCEGVREVFYAAKRTSENGSPMLFGNVSNGVNTPYFLGSSKDSAPFGNSSALKKADVRVDGYRALHNCVFRGYLGDVGTRYGTDMGEFHVVSASLPDGTVTKLNAIACDNGYKDRTGGWLVGEILVYDQALTADERRQINRYLMKKWMKDYRDLDVGEVVFHGAGGTVSVPAGRVARVGSLSVMDGDNVVSKTIVKKGAGRLVVDGTAPAGITIDVQEGELEYAGAEVASSAPAEDPYLWLDATVETSFVFSGSDSTFTRWNDCRGADSEYYAQIPPADVNTAYITKEEFKDNLPSRISTEDSDVPTKLAVADFGKTSDKTASFMFIGSADTTPKTYAGFVVYKPLASMWGINVSPFGASDPHMMFSYCAALNSAQAFPSAASSVWTLDGRPIDPFFRSKAIFMNYDYHVFSFSGVEPSLVNMIAKYTFDQAAGGNIRVGEMVLYDRVLTVDECRDTEAYLMKKWLNKEHPMSAAGAATEYTFADGEDAVFTVEDALSVTSISGGTGKLVKKGAGTLTVTETADAPYIEAIDIQTGSVTVETDAGAAWGSEVTDISIAKDSTLNVSGTFALAAGGTFSVTGFADAGEGVYTLVEADELTGGASLADWTFSSDVDVKKVAFLKVNGNRIVLEILPRGFVLTVR